MKVASATAPYNTPSRLNYDNVLQNGIPAQWLQPELLFADGQDDLTLAQQWEADRPLQWDAQDTGSFSWFNAGKNFLAGLLAPITNIIKHPIKAALGIAGGIALATFFPVTIPLMFAGGVIFGGYKLAKGVYNAVSLYGQGDYRGAENAFYDIGEGTSSLGITLISRRRAAGAAAEAKATITGVDPKIAGAQARNLGFWDSIKESFSIFSKEGLAALWKNLLDPIKNWGVTNRAQLIPAIETLMNFIPSLKSLPIVPILEAIFSMLSKVPDCPMMYARHAAVYPGALGKRDNQKEAYQYQNRVFSTYY